MWLLLQLQWFQQDHYFKTKSNQKKEPMAAEGSPRSLTPQLWWACKTSISCTSGSSSHHQPFHSSTGVLTSAWVKAQTGQKQGMQDAASWPRLSPEDRWRSYPPTSGHSAHFLTIPASSTEERDGEQTFPGNKIILAWTVFGNGNCTFFYHELPQATRYKPSTESMSLSLLVARTSVKTLRWTPPMCPAHGPREDQTHRSPRMGSSPLAPHSTPANKSFESGPPYIFPSCFWFGSRILFAFSGFIYFMFYLMGLWREKMQTNV